jgi:hypothetical protein
MTDYGIPATPHRNGGREPWRVKGGQKPAYVTVIGRPSRWGNPHPLGEPCQACPAGTVHPDRVDAIAAYRRTEVTPELEAAARATLRGRVLWCPGCPPDVGPCHGDVLLELANA